MPATKRTVHFGDRIRPIELEYSDTKIFFKCNSYGGRSHNLCWHEFTIHHNGQLDYLGNQQQVILNGLWDAVDGEEFYPVAYQRAKNVDTFLARSCKAALDKLFGLGLKLQISTGACLLISVQFNVAMYKSGQISPPILISQVVDRQMVSLEYYQGERGILNLANFGSNPYFTQVVVSLSNLATFRHVCQNIYDNDDRFRAVNGLILAQNQIRSLEPLKVFANVNYALLDLSDNCLNSATRLCRDLAHFKANELKLANNPITKSSKYPGCLQPLANNFKFVDGVPFDKLYKTYTPLNYEIDLDSDGTRIDWTNKQELQYFKESQGWHAFMIPDAENEFSKEGLFDYFFISVDQTLSEFYPCYYKFEDSEHRFIVRDCFDQIQHLVNDCNLELKIPELLNTADSPEVTLKRSISYYLRMNISRFKKGQVEPKQLIDKALQKRFNCLNRLLNLEQFQQTDGLENVIINMSSPKIVMTILSVSSRKFLGNCTELRLCNNKIMSLNYPRTLSLLASLQALDLGHNWIHDLNDIKSLGVLPLKSLRLHGNPLCSKYSLPSEYIRAVCEHFPLLTKLDEVDLSTQPGLAMQKDFLVNTAAYELVGEFFLNTYLREFEDAEQRVNLLKFYTEETVFTMTCSYDMSRMSPQLYKRIAKYSTHSRNLFKIADYSRAANSIYFGATEIMGVLMQLPNITHDFVSLQTDVMHYDGKSAIIYLTGLLRDEALCSAEHKEVYLAFSRQFILKVEAEGLGIGGKAKRLKITNERFNIMNPTQKQVKNAFKFDACPTAIDEPKNDETDVNVKEHKLLIFQEITGLRSVWCTRCLEEANWNYEQALELFLKMEANNELSDNAFI